MSDRLKELLEEAEREVMSSPFRGYYGDPDRMTPEQLKHTMQSQDRNEVFRVFTRKVREEPMKIWADHYRRTDAAQPRSGEKDG